MQCFFWQLTCCLPLHHFYLSQPFHFSFPHTFPIPSPSFLSHSLHCLTFLKFLYPLPFPFTLSTMSLAKGASSSRCKGKEVSTDDLPAETVGGEAPHSKSDRSEEGHNPSNEYPPLIDPWYNAHIHFPIMSSDYSPPPLGCVWLSLCRHDFEVSWAPLASSIPDLDIHQRTSLPVPIVTPRPNCIVKLCVWVVKYFYYFKPHSFNN